MILKNILKTKTVSIWGLGYLGYTTMLKFQNSGFNILSYSLDKQQLNLFRNGNYPTKDQAACWSRLGSLPKLDSNKIKIARYSKELFKSSYLHVIAIPEEYRKTGGESVVKRLAKIFAKYLKKSKIRPLIVFESAFIPGYIEKYFVQALKKKKVNCSKDYYLGVWFRTDWSLETFIGQKDKMPIAGNCAKSKQAMKELFDYLNMATVELNGLKEAEIYTNAINTIQAMANDFVRQLAIGYASVNMKELSEALFKNIALGDCTLNIGTGGTRMTYAIDHLIQGSDSPEKLTLLKEFQDINISSVLNYAEYIIRHGFKSVAILGITYKGNQKDLTLSPGVTLAEYLIKNSVKVLLNDPFCSKSEIRKLIRGAKIVDFPEGAFSADVLVITCDHNEYKYLSQCSLDRLDKKTKVIIDNYGIWSNLSFGKGIRYHCIGDSSLNILR